jgi:hypothetical protein
MSLAPDALQSKSTCSVSKETQERKKKKGAGKQPKDRVEGLEEGDFFIFIFIFIFFFYLPRIGLRGLRKVPEEVIPLAIKHATTSLKRST